MLGLETVHPTEQEQNEYEVFESEQEESSQTYLIVSFSIPSSIKISKIFCLWSPWS